MKVFTVIILLALTALNGFTLMQVRDLTDFQVAQAWWVENYQKLQDLYSSESYISTQSDSLDAALEQFGAATDNSGSTDTDTNTDNTDTTVDNTTSTSNDDALAVLNELKEKYVVVWDQDAKFTIIEYTSPTCSFCQRQHNEKTLEQVAEQAWDVNYINVVYSRSDTDTNVGQVLYCGLELGGADTYIEMLDYVFEQGYSALTDTEYAADRFGIEGLTECAESQSYFTDINSQTQTAYDLFGVNGTPGNIVINNETGEFENIAGAHPVETFVSTIDSMRS